MNILNSIRSIIRKMFQKNEYEQIARGPVALSSELINAIDLWAAMLAGKAYWTEQSPSIRIEQGIVREFADIITTEIDAKNTNEKINSQLKKVVSELNENIQDALALGSMIIKPYLTSTGLKYEFVDAQNFIPVKYGDDGKPTDVMFLQTIQESDRSWIHRIERHRLTEEGLEITNKAYRSSNRSTIGRQISLSDAGFDVLIEAVTYPINVMDFGYFKAPLKNKIDHSQCGVSIYANSVELIKKADKQAARIDWEYESGERAIHVDERALKHTEGGAYLPQHGKRLYRGLSLEGGNSGELFKEYSPAMRDGAFREGLETYLRQIEFNVGLAYGDLSNANYVDKTATEIKASKQRKYNRVAAIEEKIKVCLEDYAKAVAFYLGLWNTNNETIITFSDSILADEETERQQDRDDVQLGVMSLAEYRAKWYGEDLETAKQNIPETLSLFGD